MVQFDLLPCPPGRDCGDHFKVVGLKSLANTKKHSGRCFAIYLAFARHLTVCTTSKSTHVILSNIANIDSVEASLAILIARKKVLCDVSYRDTVCSPLVTAHHC